MKEWFRPLFVYKKYLLAEKILKHCCASYGWVENSAHEKPFLTAKVFPNHFIKPNYLNKDFSEDPSRNIEAIDLLEKNRHITTKRNNNLYEFSIAATKEGEIAINEGFYRVAVYKLFAKIIAATGIGSLLIWLLTRYLL